MTKIRIGTRKSKLALIQTDIVAAKIKEAFPHCEIEIVTHDTKGDEILDKSLVEIGGKGVFTQELEEALVNGNIDLAVHSAKDMPMDFPEGLGIGAVLKREDERDVILTRSQTEGDWESLLKNGAVIGTSSLRRELLLKECYPKVRIKVIRGNVQTRINKLKEGEYDGILLAAAGLKRLNLTPDNTGLDFHYLKPDEFLPAAGQGILAVESRNGDLADVLGRIHDEKAANLLAAERSFLKSIGGSCNAPCAGTAMYKDDKTLSMKVWYSRDGIHGKRAGMDMDAGQAEKLGRALARKVQTGMVYLIGAGPGNRELVTRRCLECLKSADVVVYDSLACNSLLNETNVNAELIYAGKRSSHHHLKQGQTNELLIELAKEGKNVVRLKGGDPFIFGRGGEEAAELKEAGIEYEIVPGISSCYSAPAYAGIPVTHREYASSFHVITGHEGEHKEGHTVLDYDTLAREEGTLVFLMGLKNLGNIAKELISHGKSKKTSAAVIQEGTTARQRVVCGTLENITDKVKEAGIKTPAITVVGDVVSLQDTLSWVGGKPLSGKRVLLTGTKDITEKLYDELYAYGAEPICYSLIYSQRCKNTELKSAIESVGSYTWLVLTSANGVNYFMEALRESKSDIRTLAGIKIAVIGEGTRQALAAYGLQADFLPTSYSSETMAKEWIPTLDVKKDKVLLLRAEEASKTLPDTLAKAGITYKALALYTTAIDYRKAEELNRMLDEKAYLDYIVFASASAVKAFASMVSGEESESKEDIIAEKTAGKAVCIGPVTAKAARRYGMSVQTEAVVYTAKGIREAICEDIK